MHPFIAIIFLLAISDGIAAVLGGWALWGLRRNMLMRLLALLLFAFGWEQFSTIIALQHRPRWAATPTMTYVVIALQGRVLRAAAIWALVGFLVKLRRQEPPPPTLIITGENQ